MVPGGVFGVLQGDARVPLSHPGPNPEVPSAAAGAQWGGPPRGQSITPCPVPPAGCRDDLHERPLHGDRGEERGAREADARPQPSEEGLRRARVHQRWLRPLRVAHTARLGGVHDPAALEGVPGANARGHPRIRRDGQEEGREPRAAAEESAGDGRRRTRRGGEARGRERDAQIPEV